MAHVKVVGNAAVITSTVKLDVLKTVQKYRPEALVLHGGKDGNDEIFRIGVSSGSGSINKFGAAFASETNDVNGCATITIILDGHAGEVKEWIADTYGEALLKLGAIEDTMDAAFVEICEDRESLLNAIEVI